MNSQEVYTDFEKSNYLNNFKLVNEMLEIIQMVNRTPNDTDLGKMVRKFINLYHNEQSS